MQISEKSIRAGLAALLCALGMGVSQWVASPQVTAFLIYLYTGRNARSFVECPQLAVRFAESAPAAPRPTLAVVPTQPEPEAVEVTYACDVKPDIPALLEKPISLGEAPAVLILSTHSTESYTRAGEDYAESANYRTLDPEYNMVSIGSYVAERLQAQGIQVFQDTEFHDYPSYNGSYAHARKSIRSYLKEHPNIGIILDLHRDAAASGSGQMRTHAQVDGQDSAQLMLVMGTDAGGLDHADWEENLALALKLHVKLEALAPGITRPLSLRAQRFNQDLSAGAMLIEVGAAGNTRAEALRAAEVLAQAVGALLSGA